MRERGTWRCFAEVSESQHSPLVLVGAPVQGPCSPLVHGRNKCSLRTDSLTLRHSESPTTAHMLDTSHPQEHQVISLQEDTPFSNAYVFLQGEICDGRLMPTHLTCVA